MKITIKIKQKELKALMKKKPHDNEASSQNSNYLLDIVKNGLLDDAISLSNFSKVLHCSDEQSEQ